MALGPIDFVALEFPGNKFKGEIMLALQELVANGTIRIIDMVVIMKDAGGEVTVREVHELDSETLRIVDPLKVEVNSMITRGDVEMIAEKLAPESTAGAFLYENLWAVKLKQAFLNADARVIMQERIPHEVVDEALEDLAALGAPIK